MLVKYHQRVPSLQRYRLQHEDMVVHQVPLDDLYPLVLTELPEETELLEDLPKVSTELFLLHVGSDAWIYATGKHSVYCNYLLLYYFLAWNHPSGNRLG